jgi:peptide-methionine (S)-S-oxide reductase
VTVGYAGGEKADPTYHSLGNHTETIRVEYDPDTVSYAELLEIFFAEHDPHAKSWSRQYASLILAADKEQLRQAEAAVDKLARESGKRVSTGVRLLDTFYPAEDYHQKFYLRRYRDIAAELQDIYPDPRDFRRSTAAARINAVLGGYGDVEAVKNMSGELGLSDNARSTLEAVAGRRMPKCAS